MRPDQLAPMIHAHQPALIRRVDAACRDIDALVTDVWGQLVKIIEATRHTPAAQLRSSIISIASVLHRAPQIVLEHVTQAAKEAEAVTLQNVVQNAGVTITEAKRFPKPNPQQARERVQGTGWQERMRALTSLADPAALAAAITTAVAKGETPVQMAKRIRPLVQGVASVARRVARTEGVRVAREIEFENYEKLGPELVVGYQVHSALVELTRPEHRRRHLTQYFREPRPGEKSMARDMPRPPLEADGSIAFNCLCYLTPIMDDGTRPAPTVSTAVTADGMNRPDYSDLTPSDAPIETGYKTDIDEIVRAGGREMFRGIDDKELAKSMAKGKDYVGGGDYGQGRYFGSEFSATRYTGDEMQGGVLRAALKPGARVIHVAELERQMQAAESAGSVPVGMDYGVYARAHGYDAIITDHDYINVVNPAALVVQKRLHPFK